MTALSIAEARSRTAEASGPGPTRPRLVAVRTTVPPAATAPIRTGLPAPSAVPIQTAIPVRTAVPLRAVTAIPALAPHPSGASPRRISAAPIRLTRRGRLVLGSLIVLMAAAIVSVLSLGLASGALASNHHGSAGAGYRGMRQVVVQPGQTLWSIAAAAEPAADPRLVIAEMTQANSLGGATVYAGEQLWVPAR